MAKQLRAELHERYANWLEARAGEDEIVGYHLEQACRYRAEVAPAGEQPSDLVVRAAERLGSAGRAALKRGDIRGAVNLLSRAALLPPPDASSRLQLLPDLAETLSSIGELARAGEVLHGLEHARAAGDAMTEEDLTVTSIDEQLGGGRGSGFQYTRPAHADALTDLAEVLRLQNRAQEAAKAAKTARRLYEQKGNVVAAGKLQELLSMVGSGPRAITTTGEA